MSAGSPSARPPWAATKGLPASAITHPWRGSATASHPRRRFATTQRRRGSAAGHRRWREGMRVGSVRRASLGLLAALLAATVAVAAPSGVAAQQAADGSADTGDLLEARIVAQRHDDGRVEFGLRLRLAGEPWSERVLPERRFLPTGTEAGRWLASSSIVLTIDSGAPDGTTYLDLRIAAQRRSDDRIEFALQHRNPGRAWSERLLPERRFLPPAARAGRWLASSTLALQITPGNQTGTDPADPDPPGGEEPTGGDQPTDGDEPGAVPISDDLLDFDMIDVHTGETVNLRSVVNGETPLLFWLWSPY